MGLLSSLFPSLRQRNDAKKYNALVDIADRVENTRRAYSNRIIADDVRFNVWANDTVARKTIKTLGRNLSNAQRDWADYIDHQGAEALAAKIGDMQAIGAIYAQNAFNGAGHTTIAAQIAKTAEQAAIDRRGMENRAHEAEIRKYGATIRDLVGAAMDSIPSNVVNAKLDYNFSKSEKMKVQKPWKALLSDAGRLVTTYFTFGLGTGIYDALTGIQGRSQQTLMGQQAAYDRIYGPGVRQVKPHGPDLTALVGLAGSYFAGGAAGAGAAGGKKVSGIHGTKVVMPRQKAGFDWGGALRIGASVLGGGSGWSAPSLYGRTTYGRM